MEAFMIYSFDKISISYYDSPESLIEEFNLEVKGVLDSGFRYLYSELADVFYS
ncbi:hypothetical protein [Escherichia phage e4/1c]|uniref:Uncharacterized protein n=1 Tax=Escherichia phage e4/1c TaxID=1495286 RepID=A0A023ZUB6_9CAUD|nr:hypothetical protein e41c_0009 [Escherichia phage e4/1c]AHY83159.1 hypothetical protein [Escherichia phage e4/1c]